MCAFHEPFPEAFSKVFPEVHLEVVLPSIPCSPLFVLPFSMQGFNNRLLLYLYQCFVRNTLQFDSALILSNSAIDMKFAPPDAYLNVSYLEETILFHFILTECKLIAEIFKRFMDDGFGLWPNYADNGVFREVLNELKMTIEKRKIVTTKILIHFKLVRCFCYFTLKYYFWNWYIF